MKTMTFAMACFLTVSSSASAQIKCPSTSLIEENIDAFVNNKMDKDNFRENKITLDSRTWIFESNLQSNDIKRKKTKSLNKEIADVDEHMCNYLVFPNDSNMEDASITLRVVLK